MANDPSCLRSDSHANTTPDLASPRLTPASETPLPLRVRLETIIALSLTAWGLALVAIAVVKTLLEGTPS